MKAGEYKIMCIIVKGMVMTEASGQQEQVLRGKVATWFCRSMDGAAG